MQVVITSKSNNLIKKAKKLLKKKYRDHSYLIEGWHLFEEAEKAGAEFLNIFVLEDYADRVSHFSMVTYVTPEILKELTDSKTPQGIIAELATGRCSRPRKCGNDDSYSRCRWFGRCVDFRKIS